MIFKIWIFAQKHFFSFRICWSLAAPEDFDISGATAGNMGIIKQSSCCGYGMDGMATGGYDCIDIPGAVTGTKMTKGAGERFCGRNLVTASGAVSKTICSKYLWIFKKLTNFSYFYCVLQVQISRSGQAL